MNAPVRIDVDEERWRAAWAEVHAWRGDAMQLFAAAEEAVTRSLAALASCEDRGVAVSCRHLVGQRFADLEAALAGPFAVDAGKALEALRTFRWHEPLRTRLCHGTARLSLDRHGRWVLLLRVTAFRGGTMQSDVGGLEKAEARAALEGLRSDSRALVAALQSLRDRLRPGGRSKPAAKIGTITPIDGERASDDLGHTAPGHGLGDAPASQSDRKT